MCNLIIILGFWVMGEEKMAYLSWSPHLFMEWEGALSFSFFSDIQDLWLSLSLNKRLPLNEPFMKVSRIDT